MTDTASLRDLAQIYFARGKPQDKYDGRIILNAANEIEELRREKDELQLVIIQLFSKIRHMEERRTNGTSVQSCN